MKIDKVIRDAYSEHLALNELLEGEVLKLRTQLDRHWHFTHRLKSEESFAQKIEAGLCRPGMVLEDFFACTIVVRNSSEIAAATRLVEDIVDVKERKPQSPSATKSRPAEFQFDDLRLYAQLKPGYREPQPIHGILFEVQIKTFLQHAWGIATHDLTYKTDDVKWSKLRVAYQIRAMLEHAELSIEQFEKLAQSEIISKEFEEYSQIDYIIQRLRDAWPTAALPKDLQRSAKTIKTAIEALQVPLEEAFECLKRDTDAGAGAKNLNLSPLGAVVQAILNHQPLDAKALAKRAARQRGPKARVSNSIEVPRHLQELAEKLFVFY